MANELASVNDSSEDVVQSRDTSTASTLFDEVRDMILSSMKAASSTRTDQAEAVTARSETDIQDRVKDKEGSSGKGAKIEASSPAPVGRGDTRPTAGGSASGHVSGSGHRHGTPTTFADDVADNMKEHPVATGVETLIFPPLVLLDTEIRKLTDKPVSRTGR